MKGYMVVFFTQQNRRYIGKMFGEGIADAAKEMLLQLPKTGAWMGAIYVCLGIFRF